jgi:predicted metal-dependent phosphoesterase TrpH
MTSRARLLLFPLLAALAPLAACSTGQQHYILDHWVMPSAYHPPLAPAAKVGSPYRVLAGDLHCHVRPPDAAWHVTRDLGDTITLARKEKLDFVVLTPHVWSRFFGEQELRDRAVAASRELRGAIAASNATDVMLIPGFEYTDGAYGHAGMAFADVEQVLGEVPLADAQADAGRFVERWVKDGGLYWVNHPLVLPIRSIIPSARANLSWRPMTGTGPFPADIAAIDRLAFGFEVFNLSVTEMRDRVLLDDTEHTLVDSLHRLDAEIVARGRRMTPIGGSDSHSHHLRATTYVLATAKTEDAVRDALAAGRVCVRSPEACSFEARLPGGEWVSVGESLAATDAVEVRAHGEGITVVLDQEVVARPASDASARVATKIDACHVVRARVGQGFSAPVYVGCSF